MSQRTKGIAAVVISAVFFGLVPLFTRTICAGGGNMFSVAFYRFFLSLLPLGIYLKVKKVPMAITKEQFWKIVLITAFGYGGTALLLFFSYNYIPSGMATTIHFVYPVFVIVESIIFLKEKVRPVKILCVALCMGGILLFYNGDGSGNPLGLLLAFASGITYSFYIVYLDKSGLQEIPTLKLIFYMNGVAAVLIFAAAAATGNFTVNLTPFAWVLAFVFAAGVSFIGVFFFQRGVIGVGPQNAAILSTFEPITSLMVGVAVYKEVFSYTGVLGCILILTSVVIVARLKE